MVKLPFKIPKGQFEWKRKQEKEILGKSAAAAIRRRIRKEWNIHGLKPAIRKGHDRAIKKIARKYIKQYKETNRLDIKTLRMALKPKKSSKLLDHFNPDRSKKDGWTPYLDRRIVVDVPEIKLTKFSFFSDPQKTINYLQEISRFESDHREAKLHFEDKYCLDVVPFMLLSECWHEMIPIFTGGKMLPPMQKVLEAIGIKQSFGMLISRNVYYPDVWAFPLQRSRPSGTSTSPERLLKPDRQQYCVDLFCNQFNLWLNEVNLELKDQGYSYIMRIFLELLDNAERHSDGGKGDGAWTMSGFMFRRKHDKGEEKYLAYLGIVSLGDTFSESLKRADSLTMKRINNFVSKMKKSGAKQSVDTLMTLAALQDTITSDPEAAKREDGGVGLQDMLDFVNTFGASDDIEKLPKITIISGNSCIQLRYPYIRGAKNEDGQRLLYCNLTNSTNMVPDHEYVYDLESGIPGTAISIMFTLDHQYISNKSSQE